MENKLDWNYVLRVTTKGNKQPTRRIEKTKAEWATLLDKDTFRVTRQHGTEASGSSGLCHAHQPGKYNCICCQEPLFDSNTKFDSGTGWPSFTAPAKDNVINYIGDASHGMSRVEVQCAVCDSHLGHVFPDGGGETGLRFCINGISLKKSE